MRYQIKYVLKAGSSVHLTDERVDPPRAAEDSGRCPRCVLLTIVPTRVLARKNACHVYSERKSS